MWPANLCRICGKVNDLCHAIYTNDLSGISIEEKIKKCLRLDVSETSQRFRDNDTFQIVYL